MGNLGYLLTGLLAGAGFTWLVLRNRAAAELATLRERAANLEKQASAAETDLQKQR
jgi:hypothetical protein